MKKKKKKYAVVVTEVLQRTVIVNAEDKCDAESLVRDMYEKQDIILDYNDFIGETPIFNCTEV